MPNPPPSLDFNFLTNSLFSSFLENVIVINIVWPSGHEDPSETLEQKCIQFSIVLQASYWFSMFCNHSTDLTSVLKILSFVFIEYTFEFQICFSHCFVDSVCNIYLFIYSFIHSFIHSFFFISENCLILILFRNINLKALAN